MNFNTQLQLSGLLFDEPEELSPFGLLIHAGAKHRSIWDLDVEAIRNQVRAHRLVCFRGFSSLHEDRIADFGRSFGALLVWDFGLVREQRAARNPIRSTLTTLGEPPFLWDGLFAHAVPSLTVFHCLAAPAPGEGGETIFCDTPRLYAGATELDRQEWEHILVTYTSEREPRYGGKLTLPLLAQHPETNERTLRFAEALDEDDVAFNPTFIKVEGMTARAQEDFFLGMNQRLHQSAYCYSHSWRAGDVLIADNHALLYGRNALAPGASSHLQRVHVL
jgi:alpha-ketoglutarate-dependent taurine dioxygenase